MLQHELQENTDQMQAAQGELVKFKTYLQELLQIELLLRLFWPIDESRVCKFSSSFAVPNPAIDRVLRHHLNRFHGISRQRCWLCCEIVLHRIISRRSSRFNTSMTTSGKSWSRNSKRPLGNDWITIHWSRLIVSSMESSKNISIMSSTLVMMSIDWPMRRNRMASSKTSFKVWRPRTRTCSTVS